MLVLWKGNDRSPALGSSDGGIIGCDTSSVGDCELSDECRDLPPCEWAIVVLLALRGVSMVNIEETETKLEGIESQACEQAVKSAV